MVWDPVFGMGLHSSLTHVLESPFQRAVATSDGQLSGETNPGFDEWTCSDNDPSFAAYAKPGLIVVYLAVVPVVVLSAVAVGAR